MGLTLFQGINRKQKTRLSTCFICYSILVRLRDSLSNPSDPLRRLVEALASGDEATSVQVTPDPAVATTVRECRMLTPGEVAEIVVAYRRGGSTVALARQYGVHRHTIDRHLEAAGVVKRPVVKMAPAKIERAKELKRQGLSMNQIGRKLGVSGNTVWKALRRSTEQ